MANRPTEEETTCMDIDGDHTNPLVKKTWVEVGTKVEHTLVEHVQSEKWPSEVNELIEKPLTSEKLLAMTMKNYHLLVISTPHM